VPPKIWNNAADYEATNLSKSKASRQRALRGSTKASVPVIWRVNKKSWVTQALFGDWFKSFFFPAVENYCKQNNLTFKVLLLVVHDNAPGHPTALNSMCENIKSYFYL
jgi:hypothetical protein